MRELTVLLFVALALGGCSATIPIDHNPDLPCAGVGVGELTLVYVPNELLLRDHRGRTYVPSWPAGYTAEVRNNSAVVLDAGDRIVATEGDRLDVGGGISDDDRTIQVCDFVVEPEP